jgi:hypothetical protein
MMRLQAHPKTKVPRNTVRLNRWQARAFGTTCRDITFDIPCRTLADFTAEERRDLERRYGARILG